MYKGCVCACAFVHKMCDCVRLCLVGVFVFVCMCTEGVFVRVDRE